MYSESPLEDKLAMLERKKQFYINIIKNSMKYCSFCGRPEDKTSLMMIGNNGCICSECAQLAGRILEENKEVVEHKEITELPKPKEIKEFLDKYIIGQDLAKERISVAVYNHYKRIYNQDNSDDVEILKSNILLCGPTGTGKTEIARTIAKMLDVPFCIADATTLTESGYVGDDVETILTRLLQVSDYNVERAEKGIVFIDEIDKIARKGGNASITRDVSGEGVQQGILKIVEGSIIGVPPKGGRKHPDQPLVQIDTKNILFICAGAFEGIDKRIESRCNVKHIGFWGETKVDKTFDKNNILKSVTPADIKSFGLIPELIGRLPIITYTNELDKDALRKILTEPKNALVKQYKKLMAIDGIDLSFDNDVLDYIVEKAEANKLGARGLRGIMEDIMSKIMFDAPSSDKKKIRITLKQAKTALCDYGVE